jgi:hypothetical protein
MGWLRASEVVRKCGQSACSRGKRRAAASCATALHSLVGEAGVEEVSMRSGCAATSFLRGSADVRRPAWLCIQQLVDGLVATWRRRWRERRKPDGNQAGVDRERHDRRMREQGAKTAPGGRIARVAGCAMRAMSGMLDAVHAVDAHVGHPAM